MSGSLDSMSCTGFPLQLLCGETPSVFGAVPIVWVLSEFPWDPVW